MKLPKNSIPAIALASCLAIPLSGQAQDWAVDLTDDYQIRNITNGNTEPFTIEDTAPSDVFYISSEGNLGLGAAPPTGAFSPRLAISDPSPDIELDDPDDTQTWQIFGNGGNASTIPPSDPTYDPIGGIGFIDITANTLPFFVRSGAPTASLLVNQSGFVGVGLASPEARVHVRGETDGKILVENTPAVATSRELFEIKNNGGMSFQMTNTNANPVSTWKFVAATASNLPGGDDSFRISKVGVGPPIFQIFDTGNAILRGTLTQNSDETTKQDIEAINRQSILSKVMKLPISEWSYKSSPSSRHIGPMAQDFYEAFQLGDTDKGISSIDTAGVAFAAIQALTVELRAKEDRVHALSDKNQVLQAQLSDQDARIQQLELAVTELLNKNITEQKIVSLE